VGGGLLAEAVGLRTGWPFGDYEYGNLAPTVFGIPWVIPLAWSMMAYPALLAARRLCRGSLATPLVGALGLAAWDLFLDPMMTAEGYWHFTDPAATTLPNLPGVPLANFAGWYLVAFVMMLILDRLPRSPSPEAQPALLYLWTYVSSVVAALVFFDRPWDALYGGIAMGAVAIPYAWVLWVGRD
jgi:putative membrane protein